ncbi:hypothetical protein RFI_06613 [Reticulomyxa filosa]|uniref:Uncharacterized protein n=1 Tax=Reticulomyxa filosa TaxID=46433 RepID=X6NWY6_RETFI|nr:hypothetical protein RFI_06613 [Reticulomyxa filosa]|eukprot:ETO30501.1 hypothetical protein RFI_06613 [Reticulomyxa filosa]
MIDVQHKTILQKIYYYKTFQAQLEEKDICQELRAVIDGSNNNLLFITCKNSINVFDLNIFQFIKLDYLPSNNRIEYHCLVLKSKKKKKK